MAYSGYLIKIHGNTDYTIPLAFIQQESYSGTLSTLDREAYRDANGVLHRVAILQVPHVKFTTRPLNSAEMHALWQNIRSRYTNALEKRVIATVYIPELDGYRTEDFYIPDVETTINVISGGDSTAKYAPLQIELIGYGKALEV